MECSASRKRGAEDIAAALPDTLQKKSRPEQNLQAELERCYPLRCLCSLQLSEVYEYLDKFTQIITSEHQEVVVADEKEAGLMLFVSCLSWIGDSCHSQLVAGRVCPAIQAVVSRILSHDGTFLFKLLRLIKVKNWSYFVFTIAMLFFLLEKF